MAKDKQRKSEEARLNSKSSERTESSTARPTDLALDENLLQSLQTKIQARLGESKKIGKKKDRTNKSQDNAETDESRGKKRKLNSALVDRTSQPARTTSGDTMPVDEADELRKALKDLGGTEEDYELINGAGSDSEIEGTEAKSANIGDKKSGKSFEDGMANILKEIALAQGANVDVDFTEDESEQRQNPPEIPAQPDRSVQKKGPRSQLKCEPRADWFNISSPSINLDRGPEYTPSLYSIDQFHSHAKSLLDAENETFKKTQQSGSSQSFYNTIVASGTLSDKISALTLAVQESPLHNVKALEQLIGLASKRSRGQAVDVLRALKDLFAQGSLLPGERKLYTFVSQPAVNTALGQVRVWKLGDKLPQGIEEADIICWAYEDWLKDQYYEILKLLEIWCNDEIEFAKTRAVSYVYELLKEKPEQESNLLRLLVNKLGDPVKKIASQTSYLIMQLLSSHPAMKSIVISAIESDLLFRPGQSMVAKYYATITINQTALSSREEDVAKKLLDIYFGLFTTLLKPVANSSQVEEVEVTSTTRGQRQRLMKRKTQSKSDNSQEEELREKLVSAVLTGVNRAYPYAGTDHSNFDDHLETLFKITHSANFNTSIQAMMLIQQLTSTHQAASERFYRTLYESLLDPRLALASKQQLYLNLLHRSLKADLNVKRVKGFVKRILQTLSLHEPSFICGAYFLLKDLEKAFPSITALIDQAEDHEDGEEVFRDADEEVQEVKSAAAAATASDNAYDGHKRAPEHSNADNACAWEILPFLAHFHPSVSVSAENYLRHAKLPGKPDLTLHTLIHFLDRFVYRNPKLSSNKLRGASIMQPMVSDDTQAVLISSAERQSRLVVNSDEFRNKKGEDVAADDVFFHKYFNTLGKESKAKKQKRDQDEDEDGSIGEEGEDAVWKAMVDSAPDLEGEISDDLDDDDLDMSDSMSDMDEEDELDAVDGMGGDDSDVDIEAGIFDDMDEDMLDDGAEIQADSAQESDFEGLDSDEAEKTKSQKEKKTEKDKRKKLKALPTFASAADYAKMLDDDEDEDLG